MYEFVTEQKVTEYGFILDDSEEFGCSPDGFVGEDGGLEIKCPTDSNMITGRSWWDLMAYSEELPHLIVRVERDDEYIEKLAAEVKKAVDIIVNETENLK
jgi:hypothetical protein